MPKLAHYQPLSRGFSLPELVVGLATAGVIALVTASLMKAGIMTYNYTMRQNIMLAATRNALGGLGSLGGINQNGRGAYQVTAMNSANITVVAPGGASSNYFVSGDNMYQDRSGSTVKQAETVTSMTMNYYSIHPDTGLIMASTEAARASMVTALLTIQGKTATQKTYKFFSGAQLRNFQ